MAIHLTARQSRDGVPSGPGSVGYLRGRHALPAQRAPRRGSDSGFTAVHFYVAHPLALFGWWRGTSAVLQSTRRYSTTSQSAWNCPICTDTRSPGLTRRPLFEKAIQ